MKLKHLIIFIAVFLFFIGTSADASQVSLSPAMSCRRILSVHLYEQGVKSERSGNYSAAIRNWTIAGRLYPQSEMIKHRLDKIYDLLIKKVALKYKESLVDFRFGRKKKAIDGLISARQNLDNLNGDLDSKIGDALIRFKGENDE